MVMTECNFLPSSRMFERKQGWCASAVSQESWTCSPVIPPEYVLATNECWPRAAVEFHRKDSRP